MYDIIIIGAGPAGMTAGIYTARKQLKTLVLAKQVGGQMIWSNDIENYSGFSAISGSDLTANFKNHITTLKDALTLQEGVEVVGMQKLVTGFEITDSSGQKYHARAVIIASGREPKHLGIPGEKEFYGKGVATCATCDAPFYKDKVVAVLGGGNSALEALLELSKITKTIYSVNINNALSGEEVVMKRALSQPNIKFLNNTQALRIEGSTRVEKLIVRDNTGKETALEVNGVFVEIGYSPANTFAELVNKNDHGEIITDKNLQTSVAGIFAAGDVNDAWGEQIIIAAGEGAKAALSASRYLQK